LDTGGKVQGKEQGVKGHYKVKTKREVGKGMAKDKAGKSERNFKPSHDLFRSRSYFPCQ
jgi:hypothetical protein